MIAHGVPFMNPTVPQLAAWGGNAGVLSLGQGQSWAPPHLGLCSYRHHSYRDEHARAVRISGGLSSGFVGNGTFLVLYLLAGLAGSSPARFFIPRSYPPRPPAPFLASAGALLGFLLRHPVRRSLRRC